MARFTGVFLQDPRQKRQWTPTVSGWVEWAEAEERRRLGWFAFLCDTSNAALFR
jgi:hypothetical protein